MGKPKGESKGLEYLQRRRPAAMEHLLRFFKESGRHLEPRTRFLISIVTKVINFSPRGIEQYVKRALAEGATPDEVLDAVLLAYPCAGLTKVVDAVDVILDMKLPGFEAPGEGAAGETAAARPIPVGSAAPEPDAAAPASPAQAAPAPVEPRAPGPRWIAVAERGEIPPGGALRVVAGLHDIAVFHVNGRFHALDNRCPHRAGPLSKGQVISPPGGGEGSVLRCPLHGWKFNMASGESVDHPGARVLTYPVRVEGERVEVLLPGDGGQ